MRIRSGLTFGAISTASSPLAAAKTSYPANRRVNATKSRMSRSSSAIKIFAIHASLCFVDRQCKGECTPLPRDARTFHPDTTLVHVHNLFNDGESQTGSRRGKHQRMFTAIETLKYAFLVFQGYTYTVIFYIYLYFVPT